MGHQVSQPHQTLSRQTHDEQDYAEPGRLLPAIQSRPDGGRARIYAVFQVHALYRAEPHQATITATITDQTPGLINALINDPRTCAFRDTDREAWIDAQRAEHA